MTKENAMPGDKGTIFIEEVAGKSPINLNFTGLLETITRVPANKEQHKKDRKCQ